MELTDRDHALLYYVWQNRLMFLRHFRRKFWHDASLAAAAKRLFELREVGLITFASLPYIPERGLYCASYKGNRALHAIKLLNDDQVRDYPRRPGELTQSTRHDLSVVDLRIALEESGADATSWQTDHQLRMARRQGGGPTRTPDGAFEMEVKGKVLPCLLEFELGSYRKPKLEMVLTKLKAFYGRHHVFFVSRSKERSYTFRSWSAELGVWNDRPAQLLFGSYPSVVNDGLDGAFVDLNGEPFRF